MDLYGIAKDAVDRATSHAFERINDPNWEDLGEADLVQCYKKSLDNGLNMFKAVGVIRKTPAEIRDLLWTYSRKKEWDPSLEHIYVVQQFSDDFRIIYQRFSAPWPVSSRDFVFATRYQDVEGGILIVGESVDVGVEEVEGVVRGEVICSAYYLKSLNANNTEVTYMAAINPKGSIPTMIVNSVGKKQCSIVSKLRDIIGG